MFNITTTQSIESAYSQGLLPQRNQKGLYYHTTSCRSDLSDFHLSSENRRILNHTADFTYQVVPATDFAYSPAVQLQCRQWIKQHGWQFPTSSIKTVFTNHIFNRIYIWHFHHQVVGYAICLFTDNISHISYVFFDPQYSRQSLAIRMVLQTIIDSQSLGLKYCYLGQYSNYKRNFPGLQIFANNSWLKYNQLPPSAA